MLNVLVLCLLNSSIPIPCTKQGLWYKLRGVLLDKTIDISPAWNVSFSHCLSIDSDALEQINFRHLCPRWRYDRNQSLLHFQLQESSKDYEGAKDLITVHIYPCNLRKDALSSFSLSWLQVLTRSRTCFHFLHNLSLRETKRLCGWIERRQRIWQSSLIKDDRGENTGRRFRRALRAAPSSLVSLTVTNHTETWSTTPSLGLSPSLQTTVEQSGNLDATTVDAGFTENFGENAASTYETAVGAERSSDFHLATDDMQTGDYSQWQSLDSEKIMQASQSLMVQSSVSSVQVTSVAKPGEQDSNSLPSDQRITANQPVVSTLPLMGEVWSAFNYQKDDSGSSLRIQQTMSAPSIYDMDSLLGKDSQASKSNGIAMWLSLSPTAIISDQKAERASMESMQSTLKLPGVLSHSNPVSSSSAFIVSDVSFEPSAPATAEQIIMSSMHTVPHQLYEPSYEDLSFSVFSTVKLKALNPSLTNILEPPLSLQPTSALGDSVLQIETSDSVAPSDLHLFDSVGSDALCWENSICESKTLGSPTLQEGSGVRTVEYNMLDTPAFTDQTLPGTIEILESTLVSLIYTNINSFPSTFASNSELHPKYSSSHTKSDSIQLLTSITEAQSATIHSVGDSVSTIAYSAIMVDSVSAHSFAILESQQTSVFLETRNQMGPFSTLIQTDNMQMSAAPETFMSSERANNLSSPELDTMSSLLDVTYQTSTENFDAPTLDPAMVSSFRFESDEHFSTSQGSMWLDSSAEYLLSASHGLAFSPEFFASDVLYEQTEQYSSDGLQCTTLCKSQPISVSLVENEVSSVLGSVMETRLNSNDSEIVIDGSQTAALSPAATSHLVLATESNFDLAYNAFESVWPMFGHVSSDLLSSVKFVEGSLVSSPLEAVSVSYYYPEDLESSLNTDIHHPFPSLLPQLSTPDSALTALVPRTSMAFNPEETVKNDLDSASGDSSSSHFISNTLHSMSAEFIQSTALVTESVSLETQLSKETFLFNGTEQLSESKIKIAISSRSVEKTDSEDVTSSSLLPMLNLSYLMTSVSSLLPGSEVLLHSVSTLEAVSIDDESDILSASFSAFSFPSTSCIGMNSGSLCVAPVWLSAGSSLFLPAEVSTEPPYSIASTLSLSPFSVSISEQFTTDLPDGKFPVMSTNFDTIITRSHNEDLQPSGSFRHPAMSLGAGASRIYSDSLLPSLPLTQSRKFLVSSTELAVSATQSPQESPTLSSVTKTVPLFGAEFTSAVLLPISSPVPLTQLTPPLRPSPTAPAGSSLMGKGSSSLSFPASKAVSRKTMLGLTSQPVTEPRTTSQPVTEPRTTSQPITESRRTSLSITVPRVTSQPMTKRESEPMTKPGLASPRSSRPSLSTLQASFQLPLSTSMPTSAASLSSADGTVMTVTGSYSTGPPLGLTLLYTALPTPSLPTSKTSSSVMSVHQPSTTTESSVASSSQAASSAALVSPTGSTRTQAPQTASPPGPVPTNSTSVTPPSIQPEHLLEITLQVNSTVDIFGEEFRTSVADGLLLTLLQAMQQNQTRAKKADPIYTVEIYAVSRLGVDSVLVQFAVREDGKPTSAADILEILNRLPDLLGTLNENLPFLVTRAPTAVAVSPVAQFAGWLAGVVVLAAICIVLAALLAVFVKKSQKREGEAQSMPKRALTPFRKGRLQAAGEPVSRPRLQDPGTGSSSEIGPGLTTPTTGPAPRSPDPWQPRRAPPRGKRPAPLKKLKRKRRKVNSIRHHQVSPVESSSEESIGDPDTGDDTPARHLPQRASNRYDGVEQTREQHSPPIPAARTGPRFKSTVAPLPLLQPQRLTGHQLSDGEGEEKRQTGMGPNSRGPYRKGDAQLSVHWAPRADVDSDQQRKTEAERLRNKRRLREKQRLTQRDSSPGPHHRQGGRGHHEGRRAKRRSEAAMNRAESDIAAWRRVQAQISSLLETEPGDFNEHFRPMQGALAFPRGPAYLQGYSHAVPLEYAPFGPMLGRAPPFASARPVQPATSQLANSFGPLAQPWQKAPIPNTRHNAEFLRGLHAPSYPSTFPHSAPPPHPSFYPQPSGLADSLQDAGESSSAGLSRSTETPTTPSSLQLPPNPLLTPGSQNYLQQLMSLGHPQAPRPQGKRKGKKSVARDKDRRPHPQPPDRRAGEVGQQPT